MTSRPPFVCLLALALRRGRGSRAWAWALFSNPVRNGKYSTHCSSIHALHACSAGIDSAGSLFSVVGLDMRSVGATTTPGRSTPAISNVAMHTKNRFMWVRTLEGVDFDVAITTLANAHKLHSSTMAGAESPLHGFVYKGRFYLDPQGAYCEASMDSALVQPPQDALLEYVYSDLGLLHHDADETEACFVAGRTFLGISSNDAATLSQFLMRKSLVQSMNPKAPNSPATPRRALQVRTDNVSTF